MLSNASLVSVLRQSAPIRANVLGVGISAINMEQAVSLALSAIKNEQPGYICVTGVHGIMEAQRDPEFRHLQNSSLLTVPDGMPAVWVGKLQGHRYMDRVYGPDFMLAMCELSQEMGFSHFLYGGRPGVVEHLRSELICRFPGLRVAGTYTPPFRPLHEYEDAELTKIVSRAKPDLFWVGLSTPKQERFMAEHVGKLDTKLMVGVGAAFDIHTGAIRDSPAWVKRMGLQWLHRLIQEPERLWRRYLINNPKFLFRIALQLAGVKEYLLDCTPGSVALSFSSHTYERSPRP